MLQQAYSKAQRRMLRNRCKIELIGSNLRESERIVSGWTFDQANCRVDSGIEKLVRKSRKALHLARNKPTDETLHEARKQAKYLSAALEMLRAAGHDVTKRMLKGVTTIGKFLGKDRDLALLQSALTPKLLPHLPSARELALQIAARRKKQQCKVFAIANQVYAVKATAKRVMLKPR